MSIQSVGSTPAAFPPPSNRDATVRRESTTPGEASVPETTTPLLPQAITPTKQLAESSPTAVKKEEVAKELSKINAFVQGRASNVQFVTDEETGLDIVKVIDTATKEVIRQMPTQEAVQIAKALDQLKGLLIRQKA